MRLIDADEWINFLKKQIEDENSPGELKDFNYMIIGNIESQPTAYDLENMIKQLEEKRDYCFTEMEKEEREEMDYFSQHIFEEFYNQGKAYNDSLEIIKSGIKGVKVK